MSSVLTLEETKEIVAEIGKSVGLTLGFFYNQQYSYFQLYETTVEQKKFFWFFKKNKKVFRNLASGCLDLFSVIELAERVAREEQRILSEKERKTALIRSKYQKIIADNLVDDYLAGP